MRIRSRLVATEIRRKGTEGHFAAAPPLETLRILTRRLASEDPTGLSDPLMVSLVDVSRAHFYADAEREVYVQLPDEDPRASEPGICGKLLKTMYGTLDAAERWAAHYTAVLESAGFTPGKASPCHSYHQGHDTWLLVHGDDFMIVGRSQGRTHAINALKGAYEVTIDTAGPRPDDKHELKILGRILTFHSWGLA